MIIESDIIEGIERCQSASSVMLERMRLVMSERDSGDIGGHKTSDIRECESGDGSIPVHIPVL